VPGIQRFIKLPKKIILNKHQYLLSLDNRYLHSYGYRNSMAKKRDLIIIGGGAGGLVVASVASQLGIDVVLINKEEAMGGDCLHYGCVPSKTLLRSAAVAHLMSHADHWV